MFVELGIHKGSTIEDLTTWVRTRGKPLWVRRGEYTIVVEK